MAERVAFIFTHRIQYFSNLLDELCKRGTIDPLAIYGHETGRIDDPGFGRRITWDNRPQISCPEIVLRDAGRSKIGRSGAGLKHALASFRPSIIHLNGYGDVLQWQAWLWAKTHGVPIFLRGDGDTLNRKKSLLQQIKRKLVRIFTGQAHVVFFQGEENKRFWIDNGAKFERLCWIPCVSDTEVFRKPAFRSTEERLKFRRLHGAEADDIIFLVSGKLIARKRPADAIRALSKLQDARTRLWFLGSGPLENDLKRLAAELCMNDRILFLGFKNQTEMPSVLQAADVLVHPAERDPWPYAVLEAAHAGLALLLSDRTGSCVDWIDDHRAGLRFRCAEVHSLARAMNEAANDTKKRSAWQTSAKAAAEAHTEATFCVILEEAALRKTAK